MYDFTYGIKILIVEILNKKNLLGQTTKEIKNTFLRQKSALNSMVKNR